ncbi:MAG: glycosyltransferase [Anaerolineales bacterium]|nr:glycosyltransferase [Anaerolineales bacterium]
MRILHISQSYPPMVSGAALAVAHLAEGAAAEGHDVTVIAASDREVGYVEETGRIRVCRLPARDNPARVGQRYLLWPQRHIQALVTSPRPDIVHLHEPLLLGLCTVRIMRRLQIPLVVTLHQLPWFVTKYAPSFGGQPLNVEWLVWRYGGWFMRQCEAAIVPLPLVSNLVHHYTGYLPHTISYGIDLRRFRTEVAALTEGAQLRRKYGLPAGKPIILHVGRLDRDKDVDQVIRAAAEAMATTDAILLVVGDGREREALVQLSEALAIGDRAFFTGFVDNDGDLPGLYRLATLFVTASEIETFGIVVLEAMASGCPVVAVNAGAVPHLVLTGYSGFLAPPGDVAALADRVAWLLAHPEAARRMGQNAAGLSQEYDGARSLERHLDLYRAICGG